MKTAWKFKNSFVLKGISKKVGKKMPTEWEENILQIIYLFLNSVLSF